MESIKPFIPECSPGLKAIEIFNKLLPFSNPYRLEIDNKGLSWNKSHHILATRCAAYVMIDELVEFIDQQYQADIQVLNYWLDVKKIIAEIKDIDDNLLP